MKKVVFTGAGIGGVAAAAFLIPNGYQASVYERNVVPGGRSGNLTRDGYGPETGATPPMVTDVYRNIFSFPPCCLGEELQLKGSRLLRTTTGGQGNSSARKPSGSIFPIKTYM